MHLLLLFVSTPHIFNKTKSVESAFTLHIIMKTKRFQINITIVCEADCRASLQSKASTERRCATVGKQSYFYTLRSLVCHIMNLNHLYGFFLGAAIAFVVR